MEGMMKFISRIHRCANLWRVDKLSEEGLTGIQHIYIFHICKEPGISQETLARRISVNKSNVARQLSALENAGMITRQTSAQDKRMMEVYPTAKAQALFPKVKALMTMWNELLVEDLSEEERALLLKVLPKMAEKARALTKEKEERA